MKRILPHLALLLGLAFLGLTLLPRRNPGAFDVVGFGRLPVLADGRIKPLDTLARTSLLQIEGKQVINGPDGRELAGPDSLDPLAPRSESWKDMFSPPPPLTPDEWLLDVLFRPRIADSYRIFTIDNPELLTLIGRNDENLAIHYEKMADRLEATVGILDSRHRRFAYAEIAPFLAAIDTQARLAPVDDSARTLFQRAVVQLSANLSLYQQLEHTLEAPDSADFLGELLQFQQGLPGGVAAVRDKQASKPHDEKAAQAIIDLGERYVTLADATHILAIPPEPGDPAGAWTTAGRAILGAFDRGSVNPSALAYAGLGYSWQGQNSEQFNHLVLLYQKDIAARLAPELRKSDAEVRFNAIDPFSTSTFFYAAAFVLAIISWLKWPGPLGRAAFQLMALAWIVATAGILARVCLGGRPPVTNLYSSALFVGWGAVGLCLILEKIYRNAIGTVAGGLIGFATLVIAHYLSLGGDTLEMMRAVLDSNFWLSTHVIVVTTGYASTLLAGFLALIYIVRGVFTRSLDRATADALTRMVYGIVCFATLFSFVGTVLGGIWADQSWGRFWGWDPKENGALIIVIWNALILHARLGGLVKPRGLMCLAVFGNIVTSWSWFGTNMLGIGLHSYGFTEAAFQALSVFVASQLVFIAIGNIPLEKWRSRQGG